MVARSVKRTTKISPSPFGGASLIHNLTDDEVKILLGRKPKVKASQSKPPKSRVNQVNKLSLAQEVLKHFKHDALIDAFEGQLLDHAARVISSKKYKTLDWFDKDELRGEVAELAYEIIRSWIKKANPKLI